MSLQNYFLIISVVSFVLVLFGKTVFRKKLQNTNHGFYKALSLSLALIFVVRYMIDGIPLYQQVTKLSVGLFDSSAETLLATVLVWASYVCLILVMLAPFFKIKNVTNLIKTFVFVFVILNLFFGNIYLKAIISSPETFTLKGFLVAMEMAIMLSFVALIVPNTNFFKFSKKEVLNLLITIPFLLLAVMPTYIPRILFGAGNPSIKLEELSFAHRVVLYVGFIIPLLFWLAFRKKSKEVKHFALLYLSVASLLTFLYGHTFTTLSNPRTWPLHLCNTALFIMPITLIFKSEKVFYFTYFINVLGAFLAMLMPNYSNVTLTSPWFVSFFTSHYIAFFMPLLIVALGIYQKPKIKQFRYSIVAFTVYFVSIIFINAWLTNYGSVDFFFVNSDFVVSKLGRWAEGTRNFTLEWKMFDLNFKLYPLYQVLFYLVYIAGAFGMWFIYEQVYSFAGMLSDMSTKNKILKQNKHLYFAKKKGAGNMEHKETKVVVKNASKKYAKSTNFALDGVNLEVGSGEIFGFLGPNGSGKSTLIKSIVGIQPLTSGTIEVCGYDTSQEPIKSKSVIGFVPDHYALYEKLTAREYVNYIADLYGVSNEDRDERIEKYAKSLNIEHAFDQKMNTFSHGMKQKITIISALVHNSKLLILDEPLTGLDPNTIFQVKEVMKQHAKLGNIVFFSSHIIDIVEKLCDRIAIIKDGRIVKEARLKDLEAKKVNLEKFYLDTIAEN